MLLKTSPTAIQAADPGTREGCPRKWWYRHVAGLPEQPGSPVALARGDEGHAQIAAYLRGGDRPSRGDIIRGFDRLPLPSPSLIVEEYLQVELVPGTRITAKLDLADLDDDGQPRVTDWKFPSSARYIPTAHELTTNIQMALYGYEFLRRGSPRVVLRQVHFVASPASVTEVVTSATADDLEPTLARARAIVARMLVWRTITDPEQVPGNRDACRAYGGCSYLEVCAVPHFDPLKRLLGADMGILDTLKNRAASTTPPADPLAERRAALPSDVRDACDFLSTCPLGRPALSGRAVQAWCAATGAEPISPRAGLAGSGAIGGIAIESHEQLVEIVAELRAKIAEDAEAPPEPEPERTHPASILPIDAPASDPTAHVEAAEAGAAKRKAKVKASREPGPKAVADAAGIVLVDCVEVSGAVGEAMRLEPYCHQMLRDAAAVAGAPGTDPRLSTGETLGYGRWRALVSAGVAAAPPEAGTWLLDSRGGDLIEAVIDGLVVAGVRVVRGHR